MDLMLLRANASRAAALLKSLANEDRLLLLCQLVMERKPFPS
jgi:ArsR family transcriptional regulator